MSRDAFSPRPAKSALTRATGFLHGFTHTLNLYIGCVFGCPYCYVIESPLHRFHTPEVAWGEYVHPRDGIAQCLARDLKRRADHGRSNELAIFMTSATDPYQGLERRLRLTRACLEVMQHYPPGLLLVQPRSPLVCEDYALIRGLGERCWLSFTKETDLDGVQQAVTPRCPAISARWEAPAVALDIGLNVQITVSPCLPLCSCATAGAWWWIRTLAATVCTANARRRPTSLPCIEVSAGVAGAAKRPLSPCTSGYTSASGIGRAGRKLVFQP